MTKKRLKKVYKPMAYIFIGCFLIYILLSQAMSVFSRTAEIDKLEKEVAIVKKEKKDLLFINNIQSATNEYSTQILQKQCNRQLFYSK